MNIAHDSFIPFKKNYSNEKDILLPDEKEKLVKNAKD